MMVSRGAVIRFGDPVRGEVLNVAVMTYESDDNDTTPIHLRMLEDWSRIFATFPELKEWGKEATINTLHSIHTIADYREELERIGPYTRYRFDQESTSIGDAGSLADYLERFYLQG